MMPGIKVQKKDGTQEDFNRGKILNGVIKSGATPEQAESIAAQAESWAQTAAVNGVLQTLDIRNKVLELLKAANPVAGANFEAYKKQPLPQVPQV